MSIINILSCFVQCALHFACKLLKCFRAYTIFNDCFFSSCFSTLKRFPIGFKSGLAKLLQSIRQQVAKIVETLHLLGALLIFLLSLTLQPPLPLISVASRTKKCWELKQSTLKGGEGRGSGKGLNSRYAEYWKLEKVFFNESVSTILQLVAAPKESFLHPHLYREKCLMRLHPESCNFVQLLVPLRPNGQ